MILWRLYWVKAQKLAIFDIIAQTITFCMFSSFYSIFCLGSTKNEVHICNLHAKMQLLMYDKGGLSTKKFSSPEGRWRTIRKPELGENIGFSKKALYTLHKGPIENSFEGGSFWNSDLMQIWDTLVRYGLEHSVVNTATPGCTSIHNCSRIRQIK